MEWGVGRSGAWGAAQRGAGLARRAQRNAEWKFAQAEARRGAARDSAQHGRSGAHGGRPEAQAAAQARSRALSAGRGARGAKRGKRGPAGGAGRVERCGRWHGGTRGTGRGTAQGGPGRPRGAQGAARVRAAGSGAGSAAGCGACEGGCCFPPSPHLTPRLPCLQRIPQRIAPRVRTPHAPPPVRSAPYIFRLPPPACAWSYARGRRPPERTLGASSGAGAAGGPCACPVSPRRSRGRAKGTSRSLHRPDDLLDAGAPRGEAHKAPSKVLVAWPMHPEPLGRLGEGAAHRVHHDVRHGQKEPVGHEVCEQGPRLTHIFRRVVERPAVVGVEGDLIPERHHPLSPTLLHVLHASVPRFPPPLLQNGRISYGSQGYTLNLLMRPQKT